MFLYSTSASHETAVTKVTKIELEILFKVHVTDTSIHFINTFYAEFFLTDVPPEDYSDVKNRALKLLSFS